MPLHVVFSGPPEQRVVVKPTPMTKLESVLAEACQKFKPPLDPKGFTLAFQKKTLDLQSAVRFLSLPADCRVDIVRVEEPAVVSPRSKPASISPAHITAPSSSGTNAPTTGKAAGSSSVAALHQDVVLFTQQALEQATAAQNAQGNNDPPDEFFELTAEDYFSITGSQERKKKAQANFKTQAIRTEEAQKRAASYGPVALRLHFPGGVIMQAKFSALDPLTKVKDLVSGSVRSELVSRVYLYTTPPRQVLQDLDASLHHHQLVPAAHVYVGFTGAEDVGKDSSVLRSELSEQIKQELPQDILPVLAPQPRSSNAEGSASGGDNRTATATGKTPSSSSGAAGKKPKWLKLGPS